HRGGLQGLRLHESGAALRRHEPALLRRHGRGERRQATPGLEDAVVDTVRDKTAIAGVGRTAVDRDPQSNLLLHLVRALRAAVEDAGLRASNIDGLMVMSAGTGDKMDSLPNVLGLTNLRWTYQSWSHGRNQPQDIGTAMWAVLSGQA